MPWTRPTIADITTRITKGIESRLFGNVALLRRAVLRILARVFAGAIHTSYGYLEYISRQIFVFTAEGSFLNWHGRQWGVNRRPASFAEGKVIFSGTNGTLIPAGTSVQTEAGIEYGTLLDAYIAGTTVIETVQAIEAGADGNLAVGQSVFLIEAIAGIDAEATVTVEIEGGVDSETDGAYRTRILQRIQYPPMGGNAQDYIRWALEVVGVGRAWTYPLANGIGTVVVAIITDNESSPLASTTLITNAQAYMDDKKPVTAALTVVKTTTYFGNEGVTEIYMDMRITPDSTDVRNMIIANLEDLFKPHTPGDDILISQVRSAISASGISDFVIDYIYVTGVPVPTNANIDLSGYMYPVLSNINFTELT